MASGFLSKVKSNVADKIRTKFSSSEYVVRYNQFVTEELDPEQTLTLVANRPKVLRFREAPLRTYIPEAGAEVIALRYVDPEDPTVVAIEPLATGSNLILEMGVGFNHDL